MLFDYFIDIRSVKEINPDLVEYIKDKEIDLVGLGFKKVTKKRDSIVISKSIDKTNHAHVDIVVSSLDIAPRIVFESINSLTENKDKEEIITSFNEAKKFCDDLKYKIIASYLSPKFIEGNFYSLYDDRLKETFVAMYMGKIDGECMICHKEKRVYSFNVYDEDGNYETFSYDEEHLPKIKEKLISLGVINGKRRLYARNGKAFYK